MARFKRRMLFSLTLAVLVLFGLGSGPGFIFTARARHFSVPKTFSSGVCW
jgi:hypothetical protein